jgi:phenylacetate-CoA ligase
VRYRIGDSVVLSPEATACPCGFGGRLVDRIEGRRADFVTTPSGAKISSVNFSNATKGVRGIELYQVEQRSRDEILVRVVAGTEFDADEQASLIRALRERVGEAMRITIACVGSIARERSGKFRVIKSSMEDSR